MKYDYLNIVTADNIFKNPIVNVTHGCSLNRWLCHRNVFLCFGTASGAIMFPIVTHTNISCSLGRQSGPRWAPSNLSLLEVCVPQFL
jgi:hypothetical protein